MEEQNNCETNENQNTMTNNTEIEKQNLIKLIKEWVKNDNDIRKLKEEETKRKNANKEITNKLMLLMKNNNIDCFDINDGQIMYKKKNTKKPFTVKILSKLINDYYKNDVETANNVNNFLLENREEVVSEKIVRKIHK
jgi:hypothetical protein